MSSVVQGGKLSCINASSNAFSAMSLQVAERQMRSINNNSQPSEVRIKK